MIFNKRELQAIISSVESNFVAACAMHFERLREQVAKGEAEVSYGDTATFRIFRRVTAEMLESMQEESLNRENTKARNSDSFQCAEPAKTDKAESRDVAARVPRADLRPAECRPLQDEEKNAGLEASAPGSNTPARSTARTDALMERLQALAAAGKRLNKAS